MSEEKKSGISKEELAKVTKPGEFSTFLTVHKANDYYLYCHLTRKQIKNDMHHAKLHMDGKLFTHKLFEWTRRKILPQQKELLKRMRMTRKLQSLGKLEMLRRGDTSENNILDRGFLKRRKLRNIRRYSKLIILGFKPLTKEPY